MPEAFVSHVAFSPRIALSPLRRYSPLSTGERRSSSSPYVHKTRRCRTHLRLCASSIPYSGQQHQTESNAPLQKKRGALAQLAHYAQDIAREEPFIFHRTFIAFALTIASKLLGLGVPFAFKFAYDALQSASLSSAKGHSRVALFAFLLHGIAKICAEFARELKTGLFGKAGQRLGRRITTMSLAHLHSLETAFHASSKIGALTRVVDRGTKSILNISRIILFYIVPSLFEFLLVSIVLLSRFSWPFVVVLAGTLTAYLYFSVALNIAVTNVRAEMNLIDNEASARILDSLQNHDIVAVFDNSNHEVRRLDEALASYERWAVRADWLLCWQNTGQAIILALGFTLMLVLCVTNVVNGTMTVGDTLMVSALAQQFWQPLQFIGFQYRELRQSIVDVSNLMSLLDRSPKIMDAPLVKPLVVSAGEIRFENVSFTYPDDVDVIPFLRKFEVNAGAEDDSEGHHVQLSKPQERLSGSVYDLNFTVPAGKTVALVGHSGSGKSTALRLLTRSYEISEGRILIDGQDVSKVTISSLRDAICIVSQDVALFNDTVAYNIRYGNLSATMEEVVSAAKAAAIHETIIRMPLQYETVVGERGVRMSGGERQRLSTARAILRGSKILLQDEATSALDSKTEAAVTKALNTLVLNRTRIVVAHRLSTVYDADLILVMQHGRIVEQGTHHDLLAKASGVYADMWRRQSKERPEYVFSENSLL